MIMGDHNENGLNFDFHIYCKMNKIFELMFKDRYEAECAKKERLYRIQTARRIIILFLKHHGKPSKRLIHKINHEVDSRILIHIIGLVSRHSVTIEALEDIYDTIVPTKDDGYYDDDYL